MAFAERTNIEKRKADGNFNQSQTMKMFFLSKFWLASSIFSGFICSAVKYFSLCFFKVSLFTNFNNFTEVSIFLRFKGSSYVHNIFSKNSICYPLVHRCTCADQGVRDVSFSENFAHVNK